MKLSPRMIDNCTIAFWLLLLLTFINLICFTESVTLLKNDSDHLALLAFKDGISNDPNKVFSSWNDSLHFCMWGGVTCSRRHPQRVVALNLSHQSLRGSLSPYIGNLSFLRTIELSNNTMEGHIPQEIGNLFRLRYLLLTNNSLVGEIPNNITQCLQLIAIDFYGNKLVGTIPLDIGSLSKLYSLNLGRNGISGHIPPSLGNISSLTYLYLSDNNLDGRVPDELGQLGNLQGLGLKENILSGKIPSSLYNLSFIWVLDIGENRLYGSLPSELGLFLPNLKQLYVGGNRFTGPIPVSLSNASRLVILSFGTSYFSGSLPMNLGTLKGLKWLNVENNQLVSENNEEFTFITSLTNCSGLQSLALDNNQFSGKLPNTISNLSTQLTGIWLGSNQIFGAIPTGIENLANLILLNVGDNLLTGTIPIHLTKLNRLQVLSMHGNKLSGQIPISLGNLTRLFALHLRRNNLQGSIPSSLESCQYLQYLYLGDNNLSGTIPKQVVDIPSLLEVTMNMNHLTGILPLGIGKSENLIRLDISNNRLSGEIPPFPSSLIALQELDLSRNNLTGHIPSSLAQLPSLIYLNLSFNNLEGEVPEHGIFQNVSAISILGNNKLCGGIPKLRLPKCPKQDFKKHERTFSRRMKIIVVVVVIILFSFLLLCLWAIQSKKMIEKLASTFSLKDGFLRVTYGELFKATNGFSSANLIGEGSYSSVYKGIVDRMEMIVAIKVLKLQQQRAYKSFIAECRALRSIRHRNIVRILTVCSSINFSGNDFKALVLEYMPNGSLESWLHPNAKDNHQLRFLSLIQRLNVAIDVACALDYLHHHCQAPIVHCDLKPSNVLLDDDMVAHVGDFGLAKILLEEINYSQSQTNSLAIKGTFGYVAPEYGVGAHTSTYGDVYSYGILLLEMLTGKRPNDDMFSNNLNLHQFAKMALPESVMEIIDQRLLSEEIEVIRHSENYNKIRSIMHESLVSLVKIGVSCSDDSPKERMEMKDVVVEMHKVRDFYLSAEKW